MTKTITLEHPLATQRDLELTAQIQDHVGGLHTPLIKEQMKQRDAAYGTLREAERALRENPRRLELEAVVIPVNKAIVSALRDAGLIPGKKRENMDEAFDDMNQRGEIRERITAAAGLTAKQLHEMESELARLEEPVERLRSALHLEDGNVDDRYADQGTHTEAMCFAVGKREGWRSAIKLMVLNREAMTAPDMLEKLLAAMIDDAKADDLIYELTKDEPVSGPIFKETISEE